MKGATASLCACFRPETDDLRQRILGGKFDPSATDPRDWVIRGFELRERLGKGSFGEVYRAHQQLIDRDVAIKIILPRYANHPDFIRRFEFEAQITARLEHPHIVPLYDYWREPDGAFLVMRWMRGGSLVDTLAKKVWEPPEIVQFVDQIAGALAFAHLSGVVHQDIKPANILLDEEHNVYLSDFGIAALIGSTWSPPPPEMKIDGGSTESPVFKSPELFRGGETTPQSDIYSFGVLLYLLLTGVFPFQELSGQELISTHLSEPLPSVHERRLNIPPAVDNVIRKATEKNPTDRYLDTLALAKDFRKALLTEVYDLPRAPIQNPYKGLRAFQEADAGDFFGREALVEQLVTHLQGPTPRSLAIVGPSGCGKSSVVNAGLIPALRKGAIPRSEQWYIVKMALGEHPKDDLYNALLSVGVDIPASLGDRDDYDAGLALMINQILPDDKSELLLVIDQFEELFTLVKDETERTEFLQLLLTAVTDPGSRVRLIITLRADFYDRPLLYAGFGEIFRQSTQVVLPLSPEELERAISGPAERVALQAEPSLIAKMVADVIDQPGALPLLQYTLTELFEGRDKDTLTLVSYSEAGGISGALTRRAEAIYDDLSSAGKSAAHQLFSRLVTPGESAHDGGGTPDTRRRVLLTELTAIMPFVQGVINTFGRHRLLAFDRDPETRTPTVEIAHEALLREWQRLREWIEDNRDDLRLQRRLTAAAHEWTKSDRDPDYLVRGTRLDQFETWLDETSLDLSPLEDAYIAASLESRQKRKAVEEARRAHEEALERRSHRVLRWLAIVMGLAAIIATGLSIFAFGQRKNAEAQAQIASVRELSAAAVNNLDIDPERSVLLALQAVDKTYSVDGTVLPEAEDALHRSLQAVRVLYTLSPASGGVFSPDGNRIATGDPDGLITIWHAKTSEPIQKLTGHNGGIINIAYSWDGSLIASTSEDKTAKIWDSETGGLLLTLSGHSEALVSPAFSPDGRLLATTSYDTTARIWDLETGETLFVLEHPDITGGVAFSPDGALLAVAVDSSPGIAKIYDVASGQEVLELSGPFDGIPDIVFNHNGTRLVTVSSDSSTRVWDAKTGDELLTFYGHSGFVFGVDVSKDGKRIATGGQDGKAKVWDIETGRELLTLSGHTAGLSNVAFSPDDKFLSTDSADGTVKVWDISMEGSQEWLTLAGHDELAFGVKYSQDGTKLASASWDGTAKLWDAASGLEILTLRGHTDRVSGVDISPDGALLATSSYDGLAKIWDAVTGEELFNLGDHEGWVFDVAFSPDGATLATGSMDGTAILWDTETGENIGILAGHEFWIFDVAFSPNGDRLATAGWDGVAIIWDLASGKPIVRIAGHEGQVNSVAFSPDGDLLATSSWDGTVKIWGLSEIETGISELDQAILTLSGHNVQVWDATFSPDGARIATVAFDDAKIWDVDTGDELLTLSGGNDGPEVSFSPDGTRLATVGSGGIIQVYALRIEDLIQLAKARVTRTLTKEECQRYLHIGNCPVGVTP